MMEEKNNGIEECSLLGDLSYKALLVIIVGGIVATYILYYLLSAWYNQSPQSPSGDPRDYDSYDEYYNNFDYDDYVGIR